MPSFTLFDPATDDRAQPLTLTPASLGLVSDHAWSVTHKTLRGGRRDGVDLVILDNGPLSVAIVPTRGMGIWKGTYRGDPIGWSSPILDGPVHPAHVHLGDRGGLGWLDGFDELMVRCGLTHNGPPYEEGRTLHGLHGRIANIPAHQVSVHVDEAPPHAITVEGKVAESTVFLTQIEMTTTITTVPGSNRLTVRDAFVNRSDKPGEMQLLYHWNFGPPYLGPGSTFHAPIENLVPRDARAVEGLADWATYEGPTPGFAEQVHYCSLLAEGGQTLAMLRSQNESKAIVLRFDRTQLPYFTLWKNTAGLQDGYVTGLEPATNFPNPRPFEKDRGRVVALPPGGSYLAETTLEVLDTADAIAAVEDEIRAIQSRAKQTIHPRPVEPFAPES